MLPFSVQERDIDLILLELLHTNHSFVEWVTGRLGLMNANIKDARHSVTTALGETDVMATLTTPNGAVALMIEDKIGAMMQPRQRERYHERGQALCSDGTVAAYHVMLCAPALYHAGLPAMERWPHHLSFEDVAEWLEAEGSAPSKWKAGIFKEAQSKAMRARRADDRANTQYDPTIVKLKADYQSVVAADYPGLIASIQTGRDREYYLKGKRLPGGVRLKHSFF